MDELHDLERRARRCWLREGPARAADVYRTICDRFPDSSRHWALRGAALIAARRSGEAAECLRMSIGLRLLADEVASAASLAKVLLSIVGNDDIAEIALGRVPAEAA